MKGNNVSVSVSAYCEETYKSSNVKASVKELKDGCKVINFDAVSCVIRDKMYQDFNIICRARNESFDFFLTEALTTTFGALLTYTAQGFFTDNHRDCFVMIEFNRINASFLHASLDHAEVISEMLDGAKIRVFVDPNDNR